MLKTIINIIIFTTLFLQSVHAQKIEALLNELAQKDDLSVYTKKETSGYLTIFTRQDLDRMKIRSLSELIEKIPFLRYNENANGLSDSYYAPYQPNNPARIRVFINDRELLSPLYGSGFQIFGQTDLSYIDHIEVYIGLPSYEISIEPSVVVIKAYTKTGKRENTALVGVSGGSYGITDMYTYKSENLKDYSYFIYANNRNLKRKKLYNLDSKISRDKQTSDVYAQLTFPTSRFEMQAIKGTMDNFIGESWNITPQNSNTDFSYLYAGYSYKSEDKSLKGYINYSYISEDYHDSSSAFVGLYSISAPPFYMPVYSKEIKTHEHLVDARISKKFTFNNSSLMIGLRNRYKKFVYDKYILNNMETPVKSSYNSENILSAFGEANYYINEKNRFVFSSSIERYLEPGNVKDDTIYGVRIGELYHFGNFMQKTFLFYGKFRPSPYELLVNDMIGLNQDFLKSEKVYSVSTKSIWRKNNLMLSLLVARNIVKNSIYFMSNKYINSSNKYIFDSISFESTYMLNDLDKVMFNAWVVFEDYSKYSDDRYDKLYGGYITLFKKLGKLDSYNSLTYRGSYSGVPVGWNYDLTLSYPYSKKLSFFLKGKNLLNKALKTDYYRLNPLTNQLSVLNNVSVCDRTIWVGMEYQF